MCFSRCPAGDTRVQQHQEKHWLHSLHLLVSFSVRNVLWLQTDLKSRLHWSFNTHETLFHLKTARLSYCTGQRGPRQNTQNKREKHADHTWLGYPGLRGVINPEFLVIKKKKKCFSWQAHFLFNKLNRMLAPISIHASLLAKVFITSLLIWFSKIVPSISLSLSVDKFCKKGCRVNASSWN